MVTAVTLNNGLNYALRNDNVLVKLVGATRVDTIHAAPGELPLHQLEF